MKLTVHQFRGLEDGEYELADAGVTLFAGLNGSGKTTLCQALGSLLSGPAFIPVGLQKKDASLLLHNGAAQCELRLVAGQSFRSVQWPSGKFTTEGPTLEASEFALGLRSICDNTSDTQSGLRERAGMLSSILRTDPTREDLECAIQKEGLRLGPKGIESLWDRLQAGDVGWTEAKETGQRLKGVWQNITGQTWGAREGTNWLPKGWEPELDGVSEQTLAAACLTARQEVEALLQAGAVADAERARLTKLVNENLPILRESLPALEKLAEEYDKLVREAREKAMAPRPEAAPKTKQSAGIGAVYTCAWTGKHERLVNGKLAKVEEKHEPAQAELITPPPDPLAEWQRLQAALETQTQRLNRAQVDLQRTKEKISEAEAAEKALSELSEPVDNSQQLEAARTAEALTQTRLLAWQQKTGAAHTHEQILINQGIVKILAPEGLRAEVLSKALNAFNTVLMTFSSYARWSPVTLEHDFLPRLGGRPYQLLSESEQFRVRTVLQMAMAVHEKAPLVVIDRCDLLDRAGRNGLFNLLGKTKCPAVIAMTMSSKEECPDMTKTKVGGRSYWLGN